eukprot:CAMPEP_0206130956 /NCGR_PEP_ID=MMETSP1472-20131121/43176_1 /ASSEMBLY_ACC=CAM_ASM_001108 /TAXON_ID=41880 /ORGANISM="Pycnococcus provasolii, Strain RCC251" /LENGTH=107 /DNA_ID=CAMNT_0053522359 /DNA_START=212 /DNA_END=535 /DNA_ORIENTATION=+
MACPKIAPSVTPTGDLCAASVMVAIWLRSPHSAKNVSTKHSRKMGVQNCERSTRQASRLFDFVRGKPSEWSLNFSSTSSISSWMPPPSSLPVELRYAMYSSRMPKHV